MHGVLIGFYLGISQNQSFLQLPSAVLARPQVNVCVSACQSASPVQVTVSTWENSSSGRSSHMAAFTRGIVIVMGL